MKNRPTRQEIIDELNLIPHPEGGYYKETYRCGEEVAKGALPPRFTCSRAFSTAIYYMITADNFSAMHRIDADEIFHFYAGDPVSMLQLNDHGGRAISLGPDLQGGMSPQVLVPAGTWQGLRLREGGDYALLGCTVAPGFEFQGFELGKREKLVEAYPEFKKMIGDLTRNTD